MGDLFDTVHKTFTYVVIPADISDPVKELSYDGPERIFRDEVKKAVVSAAKVNAQALTKSLAGRSETKEDENALMKMLQSDKVVSNLSDSFEIIPLILPNKDNNFMCLNMYLDSTSVPKGLPHNKRASLAVSDNIFGDVVISSSFDNENDFYRTNYSVSQFEDLLKNPIPKEGRWNMSKAIKSSADTPKAPVEDSCVNCFKVYCDNAPRLRCSRCRSVTYCDRECQVRDWPTHKRNCIPRN